MLVGYVRVSTKEQNTARQMQLMHEKQVDKVFEEKASGAFKERPVLQDMLDFVREGDTLIVESISRLGRNISHLLRIVESLQERKIGFISIKEQCDTNTTMGRFMLTLFGAIAEMERENILERQAEGIRIAKAEGRFAGRPAKKAEGFDRVYIEWKNKRISATGAAKAIGMSRSSFYRKCKDVDEVIEF